MNDLKFAFRQLLKNPGFTAVAVLTLALGIGATTAIFNVGNALLLRPLPFKKPDQLFALTWQNPTNGNTTRQSFIHPVYEEYRDRSRAFLDLIAYSSFAEKATHSGQTERVVGQLVSVNFFSNLGIAPILGRGFLPEDEQSLEENPIIISHGLWQRRFDFDTNVVGKSFSLGTSNTLTIHTVIGVAPPGLKHFPSGLWDIDVWTPIRLLPGRPFRGEFPIMARLNPGVSRISAQAELDRITRHIEDLYRGGSVPGYEGHGLLGLGNRAKLVPAGRGSWGPYRSSRIVWNLFALFMGAVGLVLLIACANVANLLLVRAVKRRKEIAIRLALGASRVHLVRQLVVESLVLSCISGVVGLLLASWCGSLLQNLQSTSMVWVDADLSPDIRMFGFALGLSVLTGLAFGLMPALQAVKFNLHPTLKEETLNLPGTSRGFSLRNFLVVMQVAVCLVLLVGAGLCLRNFWKLQAVDPGFRAENVLIVPLDLSEHNYSPASVVRLFTELRERLSLLPGVRHVSFADGVPLSGASRGVSSPALISDYTARPGESLFLLFSEVGAEYFQTLGIPLAQGREFTPADRRGTPRVAVVNEALARRYWPGQEPLGKRINYAGGLEVVGVVKDLKFQRLWETPEPFFHLPMLQGQPSDGNLIIKMEGNPWPFLPAVRNEIRMLDKNLTVSRVRTLDQIRGDSLGGERFTMILLGLFAGIALLIAAVGLYGVIAYVTSQRTREIGVRMALGAGRGDVLGLVVRQGMGLVLAGIALGIAGATGVTRFLSGILHGVSPTDLATFFVVSLILALVALTACYLPARRAAKIDPMKALRHE